MPSVSGTTVSRVLTDLASTAEGHVKRLAGLVEEQHDDVRRLVGATAQEPTMMSSSLAAARTAYDDARVLVIDHVPAGPLQNEQLGALATVRRQLDFRLPTGSAPTSISPDTARKVHEATIQAGLYSSATSRASGAIEEAIDGTEAIAMARARNAQRLGLT